MVELVSSRDKQRFCSDKKEPKSLQLATCFPRAQNILQMLSRSWEAYSAPPDPVAEFEAALRRGAVIENYRESRQRHTHIIAAESTHWTASGGVHNRRLSSCLERQNFKG